LAVITFRALDEEIRKISKGTMSLDKVVDRLAGSDTKVTLAALRQTVESVLEKPSRTLNIDRLPGCKKFAPSSGA
jgi:hypothetical protein